MNYSDFIKQHQRKRKDQEWATDIESYERYKKMLKLALKLNHTVSIRYCKDRLQDLQCKYPSHLKESI